MAPTAVAFRVEPQRKGRQYFTAIFLRDQCTYRMVFAPDETLSDVRVLKTMKQGFYELRGVEQDSNAEWKEYDFFYDPKAASYGYDRARCYEARGKRSVEVKCD